MTVHEHRHHGRGPGLDLAGDPAREVPSQPRLIVDSHHTVGAGDDFGELKRRPPPSPAPQRERE